jgi:hypothetical protein
MTQESDSPPPPDATNPPEAGLGDDPSVVELARACIGYVERATGMKLDFEPETLPILDHYVRERRAEIVAKPELVEVLAAPVGAYLGEVIRRRIACRWYAPAGDYRRWRLELEPVFLSLNPVGAVVEAIWLQAAEGWGAHFRMRPEDARKAEAALANIPEVSEDDYYAPSSRLETLEIVVDALLAGATPEQARTYGPDDYGPFRAEAIGEALDKGAGTH